MEIVDSRGFAGGQSFTIVLEGNWRALVHVGDRTCIDIQKLLQIGSKNFQGNLGLFIFELHEVAALVVAQQNFRIS